MTVSTLACQNTIHILPSCLVCCREDMHALLFGFSKLNIHIYRVMNKDGTQNNL